MWDRTGAPEGWLWEGRVSHFLRDTVTVKKLAGLGQDLQRIGESERSIEIISPTHLGT